jgi:hypothetical protein
MQRKSVDERLLDMEREDRLSREGRRKAAMVTSLKSFIEELGDHPAAEHMAKAVEDIDSIFTKCTCGCGDKVILCKGKYI